MKMPDGTVLMHVDGAAYDPVKAHEYYLRTRKLKGRKKGQADQSGQFLTGQPKRATSFTIKSDNGMTQKLSTQELAAMRAFATMRVKRISQKLHVLESELRKRMAEARAKEREAKKPDTAAEKRDKAKASAQYRDKHKQELKTKSKHAAAKKAEHKHKTASVQELKDTIETVKGALKKAVDRQRTLMTATKN